MSKQSHHEPWNKCQVCGKFIPYFDIESGKAIHRMITPDSEVSSEDWETLCRHHYKPVRKSK